MAFMLQPHRKTVRPQPDDTPAQPEVTFMPRQTELSSPVIDSVTADDPVPQSMTKSGKKRFNHLALQGVRWLFPIIFLTLVAYSLSRTGWRNILHSLPTNPVFYALEAILFVILPFSEKIIFTRLIRSGTKIPAMIFFRKRILNNSFLEYSGESYFYLWAKTHLSITKTRLFHLVKDSAVLSGAAGFVVVFSAVVLLLFTHNTVYNTVKSYLTWKTAALIALPIVPVIVLVAGGRLATGLSRREMSLTFFVHLSRSSLTFVLEMLALFVSGAVADLALCFNLVTLRLLITRIPLLPGKDLLFLGVGFGAAKVLAVSQAALAATLVVMATIQQILDCLLIGIPWLIAHYWFRHKHPAAPAP
ncbi:MAG: hypothetical protein ABF990_06990 [Acetobacter sp.]